MATIERLREAQELERLRAEVAELKARWNDYREVSGRALHLSTMNAYSGLFGERQAALGSQYVADLLNATGAAIIGPSLLQTHQPFFGAFNDP